jgi:hypothetical protein
MGARGQPARDGARASSPRRRSVRSLTRTRPRRSCRADAERAETGEVQIPHPSGAERSFPHAALGFPPRGRWRLWRTLGALLWQLGQPHSLPFPVSGSFVLWRRSPLAPETLFGEGKCLTWLRPATHLARLPRVTAICGDRGVPLLLPAPIRHNERLGERA